MVGNCNRYRLFAYIQNAVRDYYIVVVRSALDLSAVEINFTGSRRNLVLSRVFGLGNRVALAVAEIDGNAQFLAVSKLGFLLVGDYVNGIYRFAVNSVLLFERKRNGAFAYDELAVRISNIVVVRNNGRLPLVNGAISRLNGIRSHVFGVFGRVAVSKRKYFAVGKVAVFVQARRYYERVFGQVVAVRAGLVGNCNRYRLFAYDKLARYVLDFIVGYAAVRFPSAVNFGKVNQAVFDIEFD